MAAQPRNVLNLKALLCGAWNMISDIRELRWITFTAHARRGWSA